MIELIKTNAQNGHLVPNFYNARLICETQNQLRLHMACLTPDAFRQNQNAWLSLAYTHLGKAFFSGLELRPELRLALDGNKAFENIWEPVVLPFFDTHLSEFCTVGNGYLYFTLAETGAVYLRGLTYKSLMQKYIGPGFLCSSTGQNIVRVIPVMDVPFEVLKKTFLWDGGIVSKEIKPSCLLISKDISTALSLFLVPVEDVRKSPVYFDEPSPEESATILIGNILKNPSWNLQNFDRVSHPTFLISLVSFFNGNHFFQEMLTKYPNYIKNITPEALCALRLPSGAIDGHMSVFYFLSGTSEGRSILNFLFERNPDFAKGITPQVLCALRPVSAGIFANTSVFYFLSGNSKCRANLHFLFEKNPDFAKGITPQVLCALRPVSAGIFANTSVFYFLSGKPEGRSILNFLFEKNPDLAKGITPEALCALRLPSAEIEANTSIFYFLSSYFDISSILFKILEAYQADVRFFQQVGCTSRS